MTSKALFLCFLFDRCAGFRLSAGCDWSSKASASSPALKTLFRDSRDMLALSYEGVRPLSAVSIVWECSPEVAPCSDMTKVVTCEISAVMSFTWGWQHRLVYAAALAESALSPLFISRFGLRIVHHGHMAWIQPRITGTEYVRLYALSTCFRELE